MDTAINLNYLSTDSISSEVKIPDRMPKYSPMGSLPNDDDFDNDLTDRLSVAPLEHPFILPGKVLEGKYRIIQQFEGVVIDISEEEFTAMVKDKTNPDLPDEEVTIDTYSITPDDMPLAKKGAVFYWSIYYADRPNSPRRLNSEIRFRRLRSWTKQEVERAKESGKRLAEFFKKY